MFASVGGRGLSQMTRGVPEGGNRIKLPKSASSVTRIRSLSMANRRTSRSVFPAKPAARASRTSTARVVVTHWAESTLKFSSNNRRSQDSASTISSATARATYSQTAVRSALRIGFQKLCFGLVLLFPIGSRPRITCSEVRMGHTLFDNRSDYIRAEPD